MRRGANVKCWITSPSWIPDTLLPVSEAVSGSLVAIAAKVGETRLIDNFIVLDVGPMQGDAFGMRAGGGGAGQPCDT